MANNLIITIGRQMAPAVEKLAESWHCAWESRSMTAN